MGVFGPCLEIVPGFGEYSPLVRVLKPDLTEPTRFSLYSGITHMAQGGNWWLAALVFAFSVVFPVAKVSVYWIAANDTPNHPTFKKAFRLATQLGKFSMVDVFVIALLWHRVTEPGRVTVNLCLSLRKSLFFPIAYLTGLLARGCKTSFAVAADVCWPSGELACCSCRCRCCC